MKPTSANLPIAEDYIEDAQAHEEDAEPHPGRRITRSKAKEHKALKQKSAPTSKPAPKRTLKRPAVNSPTDEGDSSKDELPEVVQDTDDDAEDHQDSDQVYNSEAESEMEQVRQQPGKSQKQERSSKPRSNTAKKDKYSNRIWKTMLFKYKEDPVALGSLIAFINSTVDKTNCPENFEARLLLSTARRIACAKKLSQGTALGGDLFCPSIAIDSDYHPRVQSYVT